MASLNVPNLLDTKNDSHFENPLEKIEQLLTCPICLDRYKFFFKK